MMTKESKALILTILRREHATRLERVMIGEQVLAGLNENERGALACVYQGQRESLADRYARHCREFQEIADLLARVEAQPVSEDGAGGAPTCALCGSHLPEGRT